MVQVGQDINPSATELRGGGDERERKGRSLWTRRVILPVLSSLFFILETVFIPQMDAYIFDEGSTNQIKIKELEIKEGAPLIGTEISSSSYPLRFCFFFLLYNFDIFLTLMLVSFLLRMIFFKFFVYSHFILIMMLIILKIFV